MSRLLTSSVGSLFFQLFVASSLVTMVLRAALDLFLLPYIPSVKCAIDFQLLAVLPNVGFNAVTTVQS